MAPTTFHQDHHNHQYNNHHNNNNNNNNTNNKIMKRENNNDHSFNNGMCSSPPLKVHRVSHAIKRSCSSSSTTSTRSVSSLLAAGSKANYNNNNNHQRGPVIIYTHSPKVIHTNPRDFMALVQKLTGMSSRSKDDIRVNNRTKCGGVIDNTANQEAFMMMKISEENSCEDDENNKNNISSGSMDDNESSSVITDENCSSGTTGDVVCHLNPGMETAVFDPVLASSQDPRVPGFPFFMNNNPSCLIRDTGDNPPMYDYMNVNLPYYNQIA